MVYKTAKVVCEYCKKTIEYEYVSGHLGHKKYRGIYMQMLHYFQRRNGCWSAHQQHLKQVRQELLGKPVSPDTVCAQCGERFYSPRRIPREYCSEQCRRIRFLEADKRGRAYHRQGLTCANCGKKIKNPPRADTLYCSPACRQGAYRQRKAKVVRRTTRKRR